MARQATRPGTAIVVAVYRFLLWLYPRRTRREHGEEMVEAVRGEWERRVDEVGGKAMLPFLGWLLVDLGRSRRVRYLNRLSYRGAQSLAVSSAEAWKRTFPTMPPSPREWSNSSVTESITEGKPLTATPREGGFGRKRG